MVSLLLSTSSTVETKMLPGNRGWSLGAAPSGDAGAAAGAAVAVAAVLAALLAASAAVAAADAAAAAAVAAAAAAAVAASGAEAGTAAAAAFWVDAVVCSGFDDMNRLSIRDLLRFPLDTVSTVIHDGAPMRHVAVRFPTSHCELADVIRTIYDRRIPIRGRPLGMD
ncbi:hypothetical protein CS006_00125 [Bifidobacterium primatium]|uniref:Uncharacterized protein n=1 Tax=Bifidobacterium primatium TaxID=2045438 RepID=A0A2M9HA07_9BIFI|nr:hypothetical protein CS006_00125 [Bifidobacterium primatium]